MRPLLQRQNLIIRKPGSSKLSTLRSLQSWSCHSLAEGSHLMMKSHRSLTILKGLAKKRCAFGRITMLDYQINTILKREVVEVHARILMATWEAKWLFEYKLLEMLSLESTDGMVQTCKPWFVTLVSHPSCIISIVVDWIGFQPNIKSVVLKRPTGSGFMS